MCCHVGSGETLGCRVKALEKELEEAQKLIHKKEAELAATHTEVTYVVKKSNGSVNAPNRWRWKMRN